MDDHVTNPIAAGAPRDPERGFVFEVFGECVWSDWITPVMEAPAASGTFGGGSRGSVVAEATLARAGGGASVAYLSPARPLSGHCVWPEAESEAMKCDSVVLALLVALLVVFAAASPLVYRPDSQYASEMMVKRNAELINGLIGMDLGKLSSVGKRSNAELINGLLGMNLNRLHSAGRR
uniref:Pigment dispersing factor n=1 Tax=Steinernema glaseri TaxID=37863 RepID=A0A1I7Z7C1_9BILA